MATSKSGRSYSYENFAAGVGSITKIEVLDAPDLADSLAHTMRIGLDDVLWGVDKRGDSWIAGLAIWEEAALPSEVKDQMR